MDATFYDEATMHRIGGGDVNQLKRNMTLDLNPSSRPMAKGPKFSALTAAPVLSSPDLKMCQLATPELEKLIMAQQNVPTPNTTARILFPASVTEEQENYARGFVEALHELQTSDSSQMSSSMDFPITSNSGGVTYTTLESQSHGINHQTTTFPSLNSYSMLSGEDPVLDANGIAIKDEPQTVPSLGSTPPMSPIDMECQEKIKLERKRQRNRIAASKCRRRKLERISRLEEKVKVLKSENADLGSVVNKLKDQVCRLKEQVMEHVHNGCQIMLSSQL